MKTTTRPEGVRAVPRQVRRRRTASRASTSRRSHPRTSPASRQDYPSALWPSAHVTKFIGSTSGRRSRPQHHRARSCSARCPTATAARTPRDRQRRDGRRHGARATSRSSACSGACIDQRRRPAASLNLPHLADRAQVRQLPLEPGGSPAYVAQRRPTTRPTASRAGAHPRLDQGRRDRRTAPGTWCWTRSARASTSTRDWPQNALLTVNTSSQDAEPHARVLRLPPRLAVRRPGREGRPTTGGDALAFKNPNGSIVTVMYNSGGAKTSIVSAAGKKVSFSMPGTGWATVVLSP